MNKKILLISFVIAISFSFNVFAGQIVRLEGEFYQKDDGRFARDEWISIDTDNDGLYEWYYFNDYGFKGFNQKINGYTLDSLGRWVKNGVVQYDTQKSGLANNYLSKSGLNTKENYSSDIIMPTAPNNSNVGIVSNNYISSQEQTTNVINGGTNSSYEDKRNLVFRIDAKSGVRVLDTKKVLGKAWVSVIEMNGSDSYIKTNSGKDTCLTIEYGINKVKENANYSLSVYVNGDFLESIEDFGTEPEKHSFYFDPNSEIMIVYNATAEEGSYLSNDNKNLYIRNARYTNKAEE